MHPGVTRIGTSHKDSRGQFSQRDIISIIINMLQGSRGLGFEFCLLVAGWRL